MSQSGAPSAGDSADRSRRIAFRALLILVVITLIAAVATGVLLFTRPSYAGMWVGPGNVQGSGDPNAIVASLALVQNLFGGISGTGTVCAASGSTLIQIPVNVEGNLSGGSANLTLHAVEHGTAILPATLATEGNLSQGQLTLSADSPAHLLLTLQHGRTSDFTAACNQLLQPASGG